MFTLPSEMEGLNKAQCFLRMHPGLLAPLQSAMQKRYLLVNNKGWRCLVLSSTGGVQHHTVLHSLKRRPNYDSFELSNYQQDCTLRSSIEIESSTSAIKEHATKHALFWMTEVKQKKS